MEENFYTIGGQVGGPSYEPLTIPTIARLNTVNWSWSIAGILKKARAGHAAIWINSRLIVVGGVDNNPFDEMPSEACELKHGRFTCTVQYAYMMGYIDYPLLFAVGSDKIKCSS